MNDLGSKVASLSLALGLILMPVKTLAEDTKRYIFKDYAPRDNAVYLMQENKHVELVDYRPNFLNETGEYQSKAKLSLELGDFKVKFDGKMVSLLFTKRF